MPQQSSDLKRRAREQLNGKWLQAGIVCFIACLVTMSFSGGNVVHSFQNVWQNEESVRVPMTYSYNGFGNLVSFVLSGPITLGVSAYFLKLIRNEGPVIENMFGGFKFFVKSFVLNFLIGLFTILWTLLLIIPGIIASLGYSMSYYIMMDNPELSASESLERSKHMMVGFKFKLFSLWCSYIGWFILGIITFGIGFLWINPYYEAAKANFYQDIRFNII
ncbi:DUF975 family protein [Clostridium estertheticum]|uniref:DUF975 family protein n=1 Tax=Clostridium estertheticum TaxID=238834 RepID=UPI001CF123ED|nr:DUF975 family protein [Clostridium estertheticum]MCB2305548.1 DUF975 family protein [Clostridium estertheticum]MCB2343987.1 DUF975 family protein [Clostridium estertheticum]MCB2348903.1 DUF975 family protein [Clostridium estertheticum]WAG46221.1 DUF975 family protein [Clostridium estertheticum]